MICSHIDLIAYQCNRGLREGDAVFLTSSYSLEGETLDAVKTWFKEWNQEVYTIGPLLPTGYGIVQENDRGSSEIREFLDKALLEHGENSVTLVSSNLDSPNVN